MASTIVRQLLIHEGITLSIPVTICGRTLNAILDTGAERTLINEKWVPVLGLKLLDKFPIDVKGALSDCVNSAQETVLSLRIGDTNFPHTALSTEIGDDLLLGADFMAAHKCVIDLGYHCFAPHYSPSRSSE